MNLRKKTYFVIPIENGLGKMFIPCSGEREEGGKRVLNSMNCSTIIYCGQSFRTSTGAIRGFSWAVCDRDRAGTC